MGEKKSNSHSENKLNSKKAKKIILPVFVVLFAVLGVILLRNTRAAVGVCSTENVVGTAVSTVSIPSDGQYKIWTRMQTETADNSSNLNGVRIELDGVTDNCFELLSTSNDAVNQWKWFDRSDTDISSPFITTNLTAGSYTLSVLGLKDGIKVDKILILDSSDNCVPSNDFSSGQPGDNCTTGTPPPLGPGDVDGDGDVDITDLSILLSNYGATGATRSIGDLNEDGQVEITDLSILLANYGN